MGVLRAYRGTGVTLVLILALMSLYRLFATFGERPHPVHIWRNADCLSITQNYHDEGMNFGEPAIHNFISDDETSGKTAGEFPGWYYLMAMLWKVFGVSEGLYRAMVGALFVLSLLILQRALEKVLGLFWSVGLVIWMFCQPALVYYGFAFLTNVPALSFALIATAYFIRYALTGKNSLLVWMAVFFALGGLLKVTALLLFFTIGALLVLEWMGVRLWEGKRFFPKPLKSLGIMSLTFLPTIAWYIWAAWYNDIHKGKYTFNGVWPLWEASEEVKDRVFTGIVDFVSWQIMSPVNWILVLLLTFLPLLFARRIPKLLWITPLILFAGCVVYSILWFQAWQDHDYYFINLYVWPLMGFSILAAVLRYLPGEGKEKIAKGVYILLIGYCAWYAQEHLQLRHWPSYEKEYLTAAETEEGYLKFFFWDHERHERGLFNIEPELERIGCGEDDLVISIPDASFSITLYLMDRKGWSNFNDKNRSAEDVYIHIDKGARFLVINEPEYETKFPWVTEFMDSLVLRHESIRVYNLDHFRSR